MRFHPIFLYIKSWNWKYFLWNSYARHFLTCFWSKINIKIMKFSFRVIFENLFINFSTKRPRFGVIILICSSEWIFGDYYGNFQQNIRLNSSVYLRERSAPISKARKNIFKSQIKTWNYKKDQKFNFFFSNFFNLH